MADLAPPPAPSGPFEGPEKLLEIWFAPSAADCPDAASSTDGKFGLRRVPRPVWEEMLDIVKCKILSAVEGTETDAYLLRSVPYHTVIVRSRIGTSPSRRSELEWPTHTTICDLLYALALSRTGAAFGVGVIVSARVPSFAPLSLVRHTPPY